VRLFGLNIQPAASRAVVRDAVGIAGAALIIYGVWLIYRPAAYVLAGLMLLTASVLLARGEG
jgi:hypothetical protein